MRENYKKLWKGTDDDFEELSQLFQYIGMRDRKLIKCMSLYPDLMKHREEIAETIEGHVYAEIEHPMYEECLWRVKKPAVLIRFIDRGVDTAFIKEHIQMPALALYLSECENRGIDVRGAGYRTFLNSGNETGIVYMRMVYRMLDNGMTWEKLEELTYDSRSAVSLHINYMRWAYGVKRFNYFLKEEAVLIEILMHKGYSHIEAERIKESLDMHSYDIERIMGFIAANSNVEEYIALGGRELSEIVRDMPCKSIPNCIISKELLNDL